MVSVRADDSPVSHNAFNRPNVKGPNGVPLVQRAGTEAGQNVAVSADLTVPGLVFERGCVSS